MPDKQNYAYKNNVLMIEEHYMSRQIARDILRLQPTQRPGHTEYSMMVLSGPPVRSSIRIFTGR